MSCDESFTRRLTLKTACWLKICHHEKRRERMGPNCICFRITNHNSTKSHRGLHVPGFQLVFNNGEGFFPCMANMWDEITHQAMFRNALATGRSIFRHFRSLRKVGEGGWAELGLEGIVLGHSWDLETVTTLDFPMHDDQMVKGTTKKVDKKESGWPENRKKALE